jgi:hypothetical protein
MPSRDYENYAPCTECGEESKYWQHDETAHTFGETNVSEDCNYDASYEGEETGWVATCDHHEFEPGCYCADNGQCEYCVEKSAMYGDYLLSMAKEA